MRPGSMVVIDIRGHVCRLGCRFRSRAVVELENLALRHQLNVLRRQAAGSAPAVYFRPLALGLALPTLAALSGGDGVGQAGSHELKQHAGDIASVNPKTPDFSALSEFLVATGSEGALVRPVSHRLRHVFELILVIVAVLIFIRARRKP